MLGSFDEGLRSCEACDLYRKYITITKDTKTEFFSLSIFFQMKDQLHNRSHLTMNNFNEVFVLAF